MTSTSIESAAPSASHHWPAELRRWSGLLVAGAMCAAYVIIRPASVDFASGDFRARLFAGGAHLWNNAWFAGHALPGYGLLPPMLGAWFGVVPLGVCSALVATVCLTLVVERCVVLHPRLADPQAATILLGLGCALNLWSGRLTFGPSIAFGAGCVLALQRRRHATAIICAVGCSLSSPVGAISLAIVLLGCWAANTFPRKPLALVAIATIGPIATLGAVFPEGGWYPFTGRSALLLASALTIVGWSGRRQRVIVWTTCAYAATAALAFVARTPLGGNIVRLAWLAAGPTAALCLRARSRALLHFVAALSIVWGWSYAKMAFQPTDATARAAFYEPLATYVNSLPGGARRIEVVPTETFRQADELALQINLARGWDTQLDRKYNPTLYDTSLTAPGFHQWLDHNAVTLVALPIGRLQHAARRETEIIQSRPPYLSLAWSNADWQVFNVAGSRPLAGNAATILKVRPESLTIDAPRTGRTEVRFHYTRLYRVTTGAACVTRAPGGWIDVQVRRPGTITLTVALSTTGLLGDAPPCD